MTSVIAELAEFSIVEPRHKILQNDSIAWITKAHLRHQKDNDRMVTTYIKKYAIKEAQIRTRYFDLDDVISDVPETMQIYGGLQSRAELTDGIGARTEAFRQLTERAVQSLYAHTTTPPEHIIHVTCTGYISPSAVQNLVSEKGWSGQTAITHAYHMGCYASLPTIRLAEGLLAVKLLADRKTTVDIVHTELCGLHMNAQQSVPEQIIVQTLFADGYIKYQAAPAGTNKAGFAVLNIQEHVIADSRQDMKWAPAAWGMEMALSQKVPEKIRGSIKPFLERLMAGTGYSLTEAMKSAQFAIHPGGPKIISSLQEYLELQDWQIQNSKNILLSRGNMSSATLPHIWKGIMDHDYSPNSLVVSLAFGPGLTMFGALFRTL